MRHVQLIARSLVLFGLLTQGAASLVAKPVTVNLLPKESKVTFRGTSKLLDFEGEGSGVTGTFKISGPKAIEGQATLPLSGLNTGMNLRDKHMKSEKTLHVEKYPEAKFVPTSLPWEDPSQVLSKSTEKGRFEGKLTLHGVEKNVGGEVSTKVVGDKVEYTFKFEVLLTSHGITPPEFSGVKVKDAVQVTVITPAKVVTQ